MTILSSKDWRAIESTDLIGSKRTLAVSGEVEMSQGNEVPVLAEAVPQGINPAILILVLEAKVSEDIGADVVTWRDAAFATEISHNQYSHVEIRGQATVEVEEILSVG